MARIRSTAKLITPTSSEARQDTLLISEAMRASSSSRPAQEMPKDSPSKPSYIEIGGSTLKERDLQAMRKLGYFSNTVNVRLPGEETTPKPGKDEVVVYKSFFKAGLWLPMYKMILKVLQRYEVYMHQLTPNAMVRLCVFIWAVRSQGGHTDADAFCKVHDLHYQTKAKDESGLHNNFGCYNFAYRKDTTGPVLAYRTKWHGDWTKEWCYAEVDSEQREDFKGILMSPLKVSFALKRPKCEMNEVADECFKAFNTVIKKIGSRDLIQEALAYNIYPTQTGWKLPKEVKSKDGELVTLAFDFKEQSSYKAPSVGWLRLIEEKCNEICGNYLVREHEDMHSIFGGRGKLRLNRVMNATGFEYPDYEDPAANAEAGEKRKRGVEGAGKTSKKNADAETEDDNESEHDEETPSGLAKKKVKISVKKGTTAKKTPATKKAAAAQEQGKDSTTTTSSFGCTRILEVMTRPLPFSTLSPLGPTLTRFMPTTKGTDEGGQSSKSKDILSKEEVESPRILGLGGAAFGGSSSSEEDDGKKSAKGGGSSGHEKVEGEPEEPSLTARTDTAIATQTTGEEIDELGFFVRHLGGGKLNDKEVLELENKGEAMGYEARAMLVGGGNEMLMSLQESRRFPSAILIPVGLCSGRRELSNSRRLKASPRALVLLPSAQPPADVLQFNSRRLTRQPTGIS
jgi:hypothetical protein